MRHCLCFSLIVALVAPLAAQQFRFRDEVFTQITRENAIAYGSATNAYTGQGEVLLLDWYEPAGDALARRPAVVVVHGGGFTSGGRGTPVFEDFCMRFARRGYVAISIDYRLVPLGTVITMATLRDAVHDYQAAVRWLRSNAAARGIDPDRILALGSSAGAITALESAYGVHDEGDSGNPGPSSRVHAVIDLWGAVANPSAIQSVDPPLFIVHGTHDQVIPFLAAEHLLLGAQWAGIPYEYHPIPGAAHAPYAEYLTLHLDDTLAFAWQHLELARVAGLSARPGYASPGQIDVDQHGLAGAFVLVAFGDTWNPTPVVGLGELCFDPAGFALVAGSALLANAPRVSTAATSLSIPSGFLGFTVHWQAVEVGSVQLLTNCVTTTF